MWRLPDVRDCIRPLEAAPILPFGPAAVVTPCGGRAVSNRPPHESYLSAVTVTTDAGRRTARASRSSARIADTFVVKPVDV